MGLIVHRAPLKANPSRQTPLASPSTPELFSPVNTSRPVSPFQLDTMPKIDICQAVSQATPIRESKTASSALSPSPFLSTL